MSALTSYVAEILKGENEMSEVKNVATRAAFGSALVELGAERDDFIVMDADLAAATQTGKFKKAYPERFYNCGIAEQNMVSIAIPSTIEKIGLGAFNNSGFKEVFFKFFFIRFICICVRNKIIKNN